MFLDALLVVSDAQAVTATAVSTNTIDLGNVTPKRQIGDGEEMGFGLQVDVAADHTTGDETYQVDLIQSANADLSSPDVLSSRIISYADLTAGATHFIPIPKGTPTKRYLGLRYTTAGTTPTITLTAWLTTSSLFSLAKPQNYAKGYSI
jgi:hypothetical protein